MSFAHFFQHLPWVTIFGLLGNTISFLVFLSPIPTFYGIYKKKSTEGFQSIPYVVAFFSAALWLFYAYIKTDVIFLVTINAFGLFIETIYLVLYLIYATKDARAFTIKLLVLFNVFGFGVIVFLTLVIAKTTHARLLLLGWICLVFALSVFVAPLGVMRQVIKTRSVKYMPFFLSFFLTISAVVWFLYGLFKKDVYVAVPNVLGFTFGIVQMILYAMYRNAKPVEDIEQAGKKVSDQIIMEPIKTTTEQPKSGNNNNNNSSNDGGGIFAAFEIPNVNNNDEPMNQKMMKKIGINNHASPQITVAV